MNSGTVITSASAVAASARFLKKLKIAIFVDSEFWHGKDWKQNKSKIKSNREFWYNKIEANIKRDKEVNKELKKQGWTVLRFWGRVIEKELEYCVGKIEKVIQNRKLSHKNL